MNRHCSLLLIIVFCISTALSAQTSTGLLQYDEDKAMDGYIFFSSTHDKESYLIDNCGRLINKWTGTRSAGLSSNLMPTGKVIRVEATTNSCCPQASVGGRIEMRDWDGNLEWSYWMSNDDFVQHHDFTLMPNGNIMVLGWELIDQTTQNNYGKEDVTIPDLWGEFIFELEPIGNDDARVVWEWHLQDHFVQDKFPLKSNYGDVSEEIGKLDVNYMGPSHWSDRDWFHCNALDYNPERDEIIINSRNIHELWILDHSTTSEEARGNTGGNRGKGGEFLFRWGNPAASKNGSNSQLQMFGSHGHEWIKPGLPNEGKIVFFNNGDARPDGYYSTAEMIDPEIDGDGNYVRNSNNVYQTQEHRILYGSDPFSLVSTYLSNVQQLQNGNFFINEGNEGRYLEVTDSGEVVWEYVAPLRYDDPIGQGLTNRFNSFRAYKYPPDYPGFEGQDLSPGSYIELTTLDFCGLLDPDLDADGDGVTADMDCNDSDPTVTLPGAPCDDGNPNTVSDELNAGCVCEGICVQLDPLVITCEVGPGFIIFSWEAVPLVSEYFLTFFAENLGLVQIITTETEFRLDGISEDEFVDLDLFAFDVSNCITFASASCTGIGVSTNNPLADISIYPNPVQDVLTIDRVSFEKAHVYDVTGKEIYVEQHDNKIQTSSLNSGMYILSLVDRDGNLIALDKFVKL